MLEALAAEASCCPDAHSHLDLWLNTANCDCCPRHGPLLRELRSAMRTEPNVNWTQLPRAGDRADRHVGDGALG